MKNIFLVVFSDQCGHCVNFKPEWENIKEDLDQFEIQEINFKTFKDAQDINNYPKKSIRSIIRGFPSIFIISRESWDSDNFKEVYTFNKDRTRHSIVSWAEETLKNIPKKNDTVIDNTKTKLLSSIHGVKFYIGSP